MLLCHLTEREREVLMGLSKFPEVGSSQGQSYDSQSFSLKTCAFHGSFAPLSCRSELTQPRIPLTGSRDVWLRPKASTVNDVPTCRDCFTAKSPPRKGFFSGLATSAHPSTFGSKGPSTRGGALPSPLTPSRLSCLCPHVCTSL